MAQAATIRTLRRFIAVVAVLVLLATACGGGSGNAVMPDLVGVNLDEAEQELDELAVDVDVTIDRVDDDAGAGTVIEQRPAAEVTLPDGAVVVLRVSDGPRSAGGGETTDDDAEDEQPVELVEVPDVAGLALAEAKQTLEDVGLHGLRGPTRGTDEAEPGTVLEQNPAAGETVEPNDTVRLVIAEAPEPGDIDQVVGTASVPEAPDGELTVVAHAANVDRIQGLAVVVHNNTSRQVRALEVTATGRNSDEALAASGSIDDLAPAIVPPGGRSLGYIFFPDPPPEGLRWTFSVNAGSGSRGSLETNMTVTEVNTSGESIVGTVVNDSGESVRFGRVVYVCFGATGQPTTANAVFTSPIDLTSGQAASFSDNHRTSCDSYLVASTGQRS